MNFAGLSMEDDVANYAVAVLIDPLSGSRYVRAVDQVSGSTGLSGAVENVLAMVRDPSQTILKVRPREEEEVELALDFDAALMTWMLRGEAARVAKTDERQRIFDVLGCAFIRWLI